MIGKTPNTIIRTFGEKILERGGFQYANLGSTLNYGWQGGQLSVSHTVGWVPHSSIMVDLTEANLPNQAAYDAFPTWTNQSSPPGNVAVKAEGMSLLDNLARIRWRIGKLEGVVGTSTGVNQITTSDSSLLHSPAAGTGVQDIVINHGFTNTWTANQIFNGDSAGAIQLNAELNGTGSINLSQTISGGTVKGTSLRVYTASGRMEWSYPQASPSHYFAFSPDLDLWGPRGNEPLARDAIGVINGSLQSFGFNNGLGSGWGIDINGNAKFATINGRLAGPSQTPTSNLNSVSGSLLITKNSSGAAKFPLSVFATPAGMATGMLGAATYSAGSAVVSIVDALGVAHGSVPQAALGDFFRLKEGDQDTWLQVGSVTDNTTHYSYATSRKSGNTTNASYFSGTPVVNYGQSGDGYLYMTADDADAPFYSVRLTTATPWNTFTEVARLGMMRNAFGVVGAYFGFGVGDYAGGNYLKYDTNGGFKILAGGGNISIDSNGISLLQGSGASNSLSFRDSIGGNVYFQQNLQLGDGVITDNQASLTVGGLFTVGVPRLLIETRSLDLSNKLDLSIGELGGGHSIAMYAAAGTFAGLLVGASNSGSAPNAMLDVRGSGIVTGGLNVGTATAAATGQVKASGVLTISGTGNSSIAGQLGIGTTTIPAGTSGSSLFAIGTDANIMGESAAGTGHSLLISQNAAFNASAWKYIETDLASNYYQSAGTHVFRVAPSGTAGNTITWTTALQINNGGDSIFSPGIRTTGSPTALLLTGAAHTTLAASTEATDISINLARTVQFATGALARQRAMLIQGPTYGFVGASVITDAATFHVQGAPLAGTSATLTNSYIAWFSHESFPATVVNDAYGAAAATLSTFLLRRGRGTLASPTIVAAGDVLGRLTFQGHSGAQFRPAGRIESVSEGTPANDTSMGARLAFFTTTDGTITLTERLRLDNAGSMLYYGAAAHGEALGIQTATELTTIGAGAFTDTAINLPTDAVIFFVATRVVTVIPVAVTFTVTGATSATVFNTVAISVAAGTTDPGTKSCPYSNLVAQKVRITPSTPPLAATGQVRVTVFYYLATVATS